MTKTFSELLVEWRQTVQAGSGKAGGDDMNPAPQVTHPDHLTRKSVPYKDLQTLRVDNMRANAKDNEAKVKASGNKRDIEDNEKMQHVGEVKFDFTKSLDRAWAHSMGPDSAKAAIKDHNKKHGTNFKELKDALDHGKKVEKETRSALDK